MDKILRAVFEGSKPKFTTYQFVEMINVGLVLSGVKKGALIHLDNKAIKTLRDAGLSVTEYPLIPKLVIVSKADPGLTEKSSHIAVGKALSYLTPIDINNNYNDAESHFLAIKIIFRRGKGRKLEGHIMEQKVIKKSEKQMMNYITPFVEAITAMKLPEEFELFDVQVEMD
jgi:hypothetical protein